MIFLTNRDNLLVATIWGTLCLVHETHSPQSVPKRSSKHRLIASIMFLEVPSLEGPFYEFYLVVKETNKEISNITYYSMFDTDYTCL